MAGGHAKGPRWAWMAVADDLTGAADLAGNLARPARPVRVSASPAALREGGASAVLDAESRFLPPAQAYRAVHQAWNRLPAPAGPSLRFQKIDSTLRGQVGPEIEAMVSANQAPWVAVLPAYPSFGRTVEGGRLKVHGRPLSTTEYAQDPLSPARVERVPALFPRGLSAHAGAALVQRGRGALAAWLRRRPKRARFISFDCREDRQVQAIAEACLDAGARHFAGASALGAALALAVHGPPQAPKPPRGPYCLLLGSVSQRAFDQLGAAQRAGLAWEPLWRRQGGRWAGLSPQARRSLRRRLSHGESVALSSLESRGAWAQWLGEGRRRGVPAALWAERSLGAVVHDALALGRGLRGFQWFVAGGHSLALFMAGAGLDRLTVLGQLQPGVPLSLAEGPKGSAWLASRPGGFGDVEALKRLVARVSR